MRNVAGIIFFALGGAIFVVSGFWVFILDLRILNEAGGFWAALLGGMLFPVMLTFAPFYAGAVWGVWYPLQVTAFGFVGGAAFIALGGWLTELNKRARRAKASH